MLEIDQIGAPAFLIEVLGPASFRFGGINTAHERQTGMRNCDVAGRTPAECMPPEAAAHVTRQYAHCVSLGALFEYEEHLELASGPKWWRTTLTPLLDADGRVECLLGVALDITAKKTADRELRAANARLALALDVLRGAHWHVDIATGVFEASPGLAVLLGEPEPRKMAAGEVAARFMPDDGPNVSVKSLVEGLCGRQVVQFGVVTADGRPRWLECRRNVIRDEAGRPEEICGIVTDVTEERMKVLLLEEQASRDPLTGLLNRRALGRHFAALAEQHVREGDTMAALTVDLDGFKAVNDTLGHGTGDAVLAEVARRIEATLRPGDVCARLGGDEFVVLAPHADVRTAARLEMQLATALTRPLRRDGMDIRVGASLGTALWTAGMTLDHVLAEADTRLYASKRQRKQIRHRTAAARAA